MAILKNACLMIPAPSRGISRREEKLCFQQQNKTALIRFDKRRIRSLCDMNYFALFLFVLSTLSASATPPTVRRYKSSREAFEGPDRTITWRAWKEAAGGEFRVEPATAILVGKCGNITWALSCTGHRSNQSNCP